MLGALGSLSSTKKEKKIHMENHFYAVQGKANCTFSTLMAISSHHTLNVARNGLFVSLSPTLILTWNASWETVVWWVTARTELQLSHRPHMPAGLF